MKFFFNVNNRSKSQHTEIPDSSSIIQEILSIIDREIESKKKAQETARKITGRSLFVVND